MRGETTFLEGELYCHLADTCIHRRASDDAERGRREVGVWISKLWMVQYVKEFSAKLNGTLLGGPVQWDYS